MVGVSLYHVYYLLFVSKGRSLLRDMLPKLRDVTDVVGLLKYNLGLSKSRPAFDRFCYIEKAEYWALVRGTIVMAGTGISCGSTTTSSDS